MDTVLPSKMNRSEDAPDARRSSSDLPQSQKSNSFLDSSPIKNGDGSSNRQTVRSDDVQWRHEMREGGEAEISGYVHPELPTGPYGVLRTNDAVPEWTGFPSSTLEPAFNSGYPGYGENPNHSGTVFSLDHSPNDLRQDFSYPHGFPAFENWSGTQDPPPLPPPRNSKPD